MPRQSRVYFLVNVFAKLCVTLTKKRLFQLRLRKACELAYRECSCSVTSYRPKACAEANQYIICSRSKAHTCVCSTSCSWNTVLLCIMTVQQTTCSGSCLDAPIIHDIDCQRFAKHLFCGWSASAADRSLTISSWPYAYNAIVIFWQGTVNCKFFVTCEASENTTYTMICLI